MHSAKKVICSREMPLFAFFYLVRRKNPHKLDVKAGGTERKPKEKSFVRGKSMAHGWGGVGSALISVMFFWSILRKIFPFIESFTANYTSGIYRSVYPYVEIVIHEYTSERLKRNDVYVAAQAYLMETTAQRARRLKAEPGRISNSIVLSMDDREQVTDEFHGVQLWWRSSKITPRNQTIGIHPSNDERRFYKLTFHRSHRQLVVEHYLRHVMEEGKLIRVRNRQRKLFMNSNSSSSSSAGSYGRAWRHVAFEHPATFDSLAMNPEKKEEIIQDLVTFQKAKAYYKKIGKAWKRGYLLYGPPGTGKSTMIAAMANFLDYDVYDLELTAVKDNTELRKLLVETTSKSIIVIEDIDCSLNLSGKREKKKETKAEEEKKLSPGRAEKEDSGSKVTLSGLLNFIDGLWSACGGERLIVFTTNHVEKLDPALIRRGRMDKHIELSYCSFEGFKLLAKNYLDLDSHPLFDTICQLLKEAKITPADVAENLLPKSINTDHDQVNTCLENLIQSLQKAKKEEALRSKNSSNKEATAVVINENEENSNQEGLGMDMENSGEIGEVN